MAYGYTGKILVAVLTGGAVTVDEHDDAWNRKYVAGAPTAMDYIPRGVPPQADPLGPENILVCAGGPLAGTAISGQGRMSVTCKSPLSGLIGDVQVGGFLPAELKMAGFGAVVVNSTGSRQRRERTRCRIPVGVICHLGRPHRKGVDASLRGADGYLILVCTAAGP
ncbi:MAG: hypothetical protein KY456_11620 [Chloroflexi bacterium]|nr:hypothetical protein [Chloroflexota bacterium]